MNEITALAAAETIAILNNTDISLVTKIPYIILKTIEDKAKEYNGKVEFDMSLQLNEQPISEESQSILAIIYKDYWCDKEKKEKMNEDIKEISKQYETELAEKLNPFKDSNKKLLENESSNNIENIKKEDKTTALIEVPKKWYVKIFDRIVRFFRKNK